MPTCLLLDNRSADMKTRKTSDRVPAEGECIVFITRSPPKLIQSTGTKGLPFTPTIRLRGGGCFGASLGK